MKTIFILHGHSANLGGVVNFYKTLSEYYDNSKFNIINIRTGRIQKYKLFNFFLFRYFDLLFNLSWYIYNLLKEQPKLIHLNPSLDRKSIYRDSFYIFLAKLVCPKNVKILIHFRGWQTQVSDEFDKYNFFNQLVAYCIRNADGIIVLSSIFKYSLENLEEECATKIHVIPTAVNTKKIRPDKYKHTKKCTKLLFLSRIIKDKGIYDLINAINLLVKEQESTALELVMAGDGDEKAKIQAFVKKMSLQDYIKFPGYLIGQKKNQIFQDSDIFIFPSYQEGCPIAALEAMSAGLPLITTSVGCLKDIVEDGLNGIIILPKSPTDIANAVKVLVERTELRKKMGQANREKALKMFDAKIIFNKIENIYDNLLASE